MKDKFKNWLKNVNGWLKSAAGKISILLFLLSIVLLIIAFSPWGNFTERNADNINNVLFGIATNLLGIIVTVSFVQYFIDKQGEQIERDKEWEKILLYNRTLKILLERYELFHYNVVTPSEKFEASNPSLKCTFDFSDICDLYESCRYIVDGINESAISVFYRSEDKVRDYMMRMLENIPFEHYKEIRDVIEKFIRLSYQRDVRGYILKGASLGFGKDGKRKMPEMIKSEIKNKNRDWIEIVAKSETANIMAPYVELYYLLQDEANMVQTYRNLIENENQKRKI